MRSPARNMRCKSSRPRKLASKVHCFPKQKVSRDVPKPSATSDTTKEPIQNHKTARRLGPTASPNGEHISGVAPHAFGCPASLDGVGVFILALGVVVVAVVLVVAVAVAAVVVAVVATVFAATTAVAAAVVAVVVVVVVVVAVAVAAVVDCEDGNPGPGRATKCRLRPS